MTITGRPLPEVMDVIDNKSNTLTLSRQLLISTQQL